MPIRQYFIYVSSLLWSLLVAANLCFPDSHSDSAVGPTLGEKLNIRLLSDHKWPEKIVYDVRPANPLEPVRKPSGMTSASHREEDRSTRLIATKDRQRRRDAMQYASDIDIDHAVPFVDP